MLETVVGALLGVPVTLGQAALGKLLRGRAEESRLAFLVDEVLSDLASPKRVAEYVDATLPDDVSMDFGRWRESLSALVADESFFNELAQVWIDSSEGETILKIYESVLVRLGAAVDPAMQMDKRTRDICAETLLQLIGYRLDPVQIAPLLDQNKAERSSASRLVDAVQARIERVADGADLDSYLLKLLDFTNSDLLRGLGIEAGFDEIHQELPLETIRSRPVTSNEEILGLDWTLIYGEPGAGKTWLAYWVVRRTAVAAQIQRASLTPIENIRVPWLARCSDIDSTASLAETLPKIGDRWPNERRAKRLLKNPQQPQLFVFDSYDESSGSDQVRRHLQRIEGWGNARVLMTARPGSVPPEVGKPFMTNMDGEFHRHYVGGTLLIEPIDNATARSISAAVLTHAGPGDGRSSGLEGFQRVGEFVSNPLLATLAALATADLAPAHITVPDLYKQTVRNVLRREAATQREGGQNFHYSHIVRRIEAWIEGSEAIAWQSFASPKSIDGCGYPITSNRFEKAAVAAGFRHDEIRVAAALLIPEPDGYRYLHDTIRDHLAASYAARLFRSGCADEIAVWTPSAEVLASFLFQIGDDGGHISAWCVEPPPLDAASEQSRRWKTVIKLASLAGPAYWSTHEVGFVNHVLGWFERDAPGPLTLPLLRAVSGIVQSNDHLVPTTLDAIDTWLARNSDSKYIPGVLEQQMRFASDVSSRVPESLITWMTSFPDSIQIDSVALRISQIPTSGGGDLAFQLLNWLDQNPGNIFVDRVALAAARLGDVEQRRRAESHVLRWLSEHSASPDVAVFAEALAEIGGQEALPTALACLEDWLTANPHHPSSNAVGAAAARLRS